MTLGVVKNLLGEIKATIVDPRRRSNISKDSSGTAIDSSHKLYLFAALSGICLVDAYCISPKYVGTSLTYTSKILQGVMQRSC